MTMQKGSASARSGRPARKAPAASHRAEMRPSTAAGSNVFSIMPKSNTSPAGAAASRGQKKRDAQERGWRGAAKTAAKALKALAARQSQTPRQKQGRKG